MNFPITYHLNVTRGDTLRKSFVWYSGDDLDPEDLDAADLVDLTGCTAKLQVKDAKGTVLFTLTHADGITLGGAAGTIDLVFSAARTAQTVADYRYDLQLTLANGDVKTFAQGTFGVRAETTT